MQEVPIGQMAQGTPFRPTPPPLLPDFKVLGGGKGHIYRHIDIYDIYTAIYTYIKLYIHIYTYIERCE